MDEAEAIARLRDDVANFDYDDIGEACMQALREGVSIPGIVDAMREGMDVVEGRYKDDEYYLPELVMAGETMNEALTILRPHIGKGISENGVVLIGTVRGDLHDVGKNLFVNLLEGAGFRVRDLGVNVKSEDFLSAVREDQARVICMSALISPALEEMASVVRDLEKGGLRGKIKVLIGGGAVSRKFADRISADAYARDALEGVEVVKDWLHE